MRWSSHRAGKHCGAGNPTASTYRLRALAMPSASVKKTQSRHDLVADRGPARLAGVVAQRGVDDLEGLRHLVACDAVTQERLHALLVQCRPCLNQGVRHLSYIFVRNSNN